MSVTIKDVAKLAGVSPSTVTRTCQNHPTISEGTKKRVRNAMATLGYVSNYPAILPDKPDARSVGIVLPPFVSSDVAENSFFLEAMNGISILCQEHQRTMSLVMGNNEEDLLKNARLLMDSGRADSFIFLYSKKQDLLMDYLYAGRIPYVLIGKAASCLSETIYVDTDNLQASRDAMDYLISLGHRRIAFFNGDTSYLFNQDRYAGYVQSLLQHQLGIPLEYTFRGEELMTETGLEHLKQVFTGPQAPTAILASDDMLAVRLERYLMQWNIRIPEQLSLITFNNSFIALNAYPPLTVVDINPRQLGMEAVRQLILQQDNPGGLAAKIIVPHQLIYRGSCAPWKSLQEIC